MTAGLDGIEVGFVGVGNMGGALARRMLHSGIVPCVCDPDPAVLERFSQDGATVVGTPRALADRCAIVFTCLPSADVCVAVAEAIADGAGVTTHVECSTIGRAGMARVVAAHPGIDTVDAPISGGPKGAEAGTLSAIVSGDPAVIERVRPWLERLARNVFVMGGRCGDAQIAKIVNNALSISAMLVSCEAVVLGVKAGLDPERLVAMINASTGRNSATMDKFPRAILPRTFDYGGPLSIGSKDLALYLAEAEAECVPAWSMSNAAQLWRFAVDRLGPEPDMTNVIRIMEEWAGIEVRGATNASSGGAR